MPAYFNVVFQEKDYVISSDKFQEINHSIDPILGEIIEVEREPSNDHSVLINRDMEDQHPIKAITDLQSSLDKKIEKVNSISIYDIENIINM